MEYLGILPLGFAIAGLALRSYLSMKGKAAQTESEQLPLSAHSRRVQEAMIARRFLRYHRGLAIA